MGLARFARLQCDDVARADMFFLTLDEAKQETVRTFVDQSPLARGKAPSVVAAGHIERTTREGVAVKKIDDLRQTADEIAAWPEVCPTETTGALSADCYAQTLQ